MRHAFPHKRPINTNLLVTDNIEGTLNPGNAGKPLVTAYFSSTLSIDSTVFHTGSSSCKCVNNGTANPQGVIVQSPEVYYGGKYLATAWVLGTSGQQFDFSGREDIGNSAIGEGEGDAIITMTGSWQQITTLSYTYTTAATPAFQFKQHGSSPWFAFTFWIDDVSIVRTAT